jgi:hypothetical protein
MDFESPTIVPDYQQRKLIQRLRLDGLAQFPAFRLQQWSFGIDGHRFRGAADL